MYDKQEIYNIDPELAAALDEELARQQNGIELIASENFVSKAVLAATGSHLTNKYAEGYPQKRYYGGCEKVDIVEKLAISRAKQLFGAEHANVQPHSGSQANAAVYFAYLNPGDTIMGMNLQAGGHLTHGSPVNLSGKHYNVIPYGVNSDGYIDYDELRRLARENKPKLIIAGASAYPRIINFEIFSEIAKEVSAYLMVDIAHIAGLIAAGLHPSPIPYADFVTTTTHKTLRGPRGGLILCKKEYAKDIDKAIFPGIQGGPLMHVIAAKAVSFQEALDTSFKGYCKNIISNAKALSERLIENGFNLVSGGTDNHLMLVDLRNMNVTGKETEKLLDSANITCNKNSIPMDPKSPFITSGIRIGTPAVTTRGMNTDDMREIGDIISFLIKDKGGIEEAKNRVKVLSQKYPLY